MSDNDNTSDAQSLTDAAGSASAYPTDVEWHDGIDRRTERVGGLTKREYFAGQALAGYMACASHPQAPSDATIAKYCVSVADEMVKLLSQNIENGGA